MVDKKFLHSLPQNPGVYIMYNAENVIIYVGKAKNLKNRVNQYFTQNSGHTSKVLAMVSNIDHIEYILTNSEIEALNLECSLIKKNRPKYNILLKDDKGYPYIKITNERYPRVVMARRIENDGAKYFGPYTNALNVKQIIDAFNKLFRLRQCANLTTRTKACLNNHIKICDAPCINAVSEAEYKQKIDWLTDVLSGKADTFIDMLNEKMNEASEQLNFELAADYRDKQIALKHILEKQLVVSTGNENEDIIYLHKENDRLCIQLLYVRDGKLTDKQAFFMNNAKNETDEDVLRAFILQYYQTFDIPKKIYLSCDVSEPEELEDFLSLHRGNKVSICMPKRGDKVRFLEMARKNAAEAIRLRYKKEDKKNDMSEAIEQLAYYLQLPETPVRIEAFDISHTSGTEVVASMVVFCNGTPQRSQYRKFKMKTSLKNDDYGAMRETLERRFKYFSSNDKKFPDEPDLIFVDGGAGQVHAVELIASKYGVKIPIFGIYKDDKHKTQGVTDGENTYEIPRGTKCFTLITEIQDEMHRVAISYHRLLRQKKNVESEMQTIPGVGKNRFNALMQKFSTIQALKKATVEEIASVKGISPSLAEKIHNFYKNKK